MIKILKKLISFKTITSNQKENEKALNWIKEKLKPYFKLKILKKNGFPSLMAFSLRRRPKIILAAHLDVVPGPDFLFSPKIKGKKLIGRGAFDMKFAIACYLKLVEELKNKVKDFDFGIMITSDEEVGGKNGTRFLTEKGFLPKFVFLPDGGENFKLERGAKGAWHLKIIAKGKAAHGSRPWLGKNPLWPLSYFLFELSRYFPKEPCGDKDHYHDTLNVGKIVGGKATNIVPDSIEAFLDIRLIPETKKEKIEKKIKALLKKYPNLKMKEMAFCPPYLVDLKRKEIEIYSQILKKYKIPFRTVFSHGTSDARYFFEKKIPVLLTRPKGGGHHSDKEWIDLESLVKYYRIFKEWFLKVV